MARFWGTVAFRLALSYGLLAIGSMSVISAAFYFGTVGVLERSTDGKLLSLSKRLADHFDSRGDEGLRQEIEQLLVDGIEQDTEVYLLVAPDGRKIVGNIFGWTQKSAPGSMEVLIDSGPSVGAGGEECLTPARTTREFPRMWITQCARHNLESR